MHTAIKLRLAVAAGSVAVLLGCAPGTSPEPDNDTDDSAVTVVEEHDDDRECDDEDKAKHEEPDCGRYVNGTWVFWTWVARGQRTAPLGWTRASEPRPPSNVQRPSPRSNTAKGTNTTRPAPKRDTGTGTRTRTGR
ncbi:hypothetical protein [Micromonospora arborensis]|uniref:hypothetical protein n=1 Tax=Micromonospora arborensis TaxID=2116518 RepID=UPI0037149109